MSSKDKKSKDRPESYPKPTETDTQLQNQEEFTGLKPNEPAIAEDLKRESEEATDVRRKTSR